MPKNRVLIITITSGMFVGKRVEPRTPARHLDPAAATFGRSGWTGSSAEARNGDHLVKSSSWSSRR